MVIVNSHLSEIGSEFHWLEIDHTDTFLPWPEPALWIATGRDALVAIWRSNPHRIHNKLFVPEYFCIEVIEYWKSCGVSVCYYLDNPSLQNPSWSDLKPSPGDIVLAVNYFGIREGTSWKQWHTENSEVLLVEDHSHDPLSNWSMTSQADYAFASIRKTFPVSDGAILWSPRNHILPSIEFVDNWDGSAQKLAAMFLKREYIKGAEKNHKLKLAFRQLQIEGENRLTAASFSSISPWSKAIIEPGYPKTWRVKRSQNIRQFIDCLAQISDVGFLFNNWVDFEQCPFNPIIVFPSETLRDRVRQGLIESRIYPAVHWELDSGVSREAQKLSKCILTIPLDQRYSEKDVERCAETVADLIARQ